MKRLIPAAAFVFAAVMFFVFKYGAGSDSFLYPETGTENIQSISISRGRDETVLKNTDSGWKLEKDGLLLDCIGNRIDGFLNTILSSAKYDIAGRGREVWRSLGVDPGSAVVVKISDRNWSSTVYYGKKIPGTGRIFVRVDDSTEVYEADYPGDEIYADQWFWVSLKIFRDDFDPDSVLRVSVVNGGSSTRIVRKIIKGESRWEMDFGNRKVFLDGNAMSLFLMDLCSYRGKSIVQGELKKRMSQTGSITVTKSSGEECGLIFYRDHDGGVYAESKSGGYLYSTTAAEMKRILITEEDFLNRF